MKKETVPHRYVMELDYYLLGDVSRILRCKPHQVIYLLTTRQVPEPRLRIGGRRIFTIDDIHRIADKMHVAVAQDLISKGEA